MRVLAYCLMPNHWHLLLWPRKEGDLGRFMHRLTVTHVRRWHEHHHSTGRGHVYQGTYKSFPVQEDMHFLKVAHYVERNALRANLVERAQDWRWCSLWRRQNAAGGEDGLLTEWPVPRPSDWLVRVNRPQLAAEEQALQLSVTRGRPFGDADWQARTASRLGLEKTFRPRGRPRKQPAPGPDTPKIGRKK